MQEINLLEERIGGRWTGVAFHRSNTPIDNLAKRPMRLCEAIKASHTRPVVLTQDLISCPGALRSLGWKKSGDHEIARKIAKATGTKIEIAQKIVKSTPHLDNACSVTVGNVNSPDIVVCYVQPGAAMKLVRQWQLVYGSKLDIEPSTIMSVCGSVVVKAFITGQICMSFGCPDSREYGAIGRDRLVIGLPAHLVHDLF
jgi:uncharacterized protein (DUF169 family)